MSDETRKQGSVLPLGESLAGFLCSDGVFRVKSGEFRRATVGEWWQDKANGRVYCVNSEYPQDILVEPDFPAPSHTEGGGPDDTKQVSKEQGASPSVTPGVTTGGGVVPDVETDENREREPFGDDPFIRMCRVSGNWTEHNIYGDPEACFEVGCECEPAEYWRTDMVDWALEEGKDAARAAANQTQEAVADPKTNPDPSVDPVLFSLCVERAAAAVHLFNGGTEESWAEKEQDERDSYGWLQEPVVRAVAPLLLEAGAKQERERVKARVERLQPNREPNFVVAMPPPRQRRTSKLDDMWRAVLASITEEGK